MSTLEQTFASWTPADFLAIALGAALLLFGRRLYWLALGGVGFFLGLYLAGRVLALESTGLELGIAFLAGVAGAFLAVLLQKVAIGVGGFLLGGAAAFWILSWLEPAIEWQPGPWLWVVVAVGCVVGAIFSAVLFEASLIAFSSLVGALLIATRVHLGQPEATWLFLLLLVIGLVAQGGGRRRRKRED